MFDLECREIPLRLTFVHMTMLLEYIYHGSTNLLGHAT